MWSDAHIGVAIRTGAGLKNTSEDNPVREAYRLATHEKWFNHSSWDQSSVLYAVRGLRDYWDACTVGKPIMYKNEDGKWASDWLASPDSDHSYLIAKNNISEVAKVIEDLMIQPPLILRQSDSK